MRRAAAALAAAGLAACGGGGGGAADGGSPEPAGPIVVGSKNFTEQVVLGEMIAVLLEEGGGPAPGGAGASAPDAPTRRRVQRRFDLGGTFICFNALKAGEIDVYVEYTGTALTAILKEPPTQDSDAAFATVTRRFSEEFDLEWTEPLGFRNDFAIIVRPEDAATHSLGTISDLARVAGRMRAGFGPEFLSRADGYPGLSRTYGLEFREHPLQMDLGLLYRALSERKVDVVAGNSTDGLIDALGLVVLEDDRAYFPAYEAAPVVRRASLARHAGLREALGSLGGRLTAADMRRLNYAVDGNKEDPREVARGFLREQGLVP